MMKPANTFGPHLMPIGVLIVALVAMPHALAQTETAISTDGVIESKEGGFMFPDGTVL